MSRKRKKLMSGQLGLWECVACGRTKRCKQLALADGWLNYRGGRLCNWCHRKLAELPVGTSVLLGGGCKLVKVSERGEKA